LRSPGFFEGLFVCLRDIVGLAPHPTGLGENRRCLHGAGCSLNVNRPVKHLGSVNRVIDMPLALSSHAASRYLPRERDVASRLCGKLLLRVTCKTGLDTGLTAPRVTRLMYAARRLAMHAVGRAPTPEVATIDLLC